jgi:hypothetical protein
MFSKAFEKWSIKQHNNTFRPRAWIFPLRLELLQECASLSCQLLTLLGAAPKPAPGPFIEALSHALLPFFGPPDVRVFRLLRCSHSLDRRMLEFSGSFTMASWACLRNPAT